MSGSKSLLVSCALSLELEQFRSVQLRYDRVAKPAETALPVFRVPVRRRAPADEAFVATGTRVTVRDEGFIGRSEAAYGNAEHWERGLGWFGNAVVTQL